MRKTLITLAGIITFVLFAAPAMPADYADVDVGIDVLSSWDIIDGCGNDITHTINADIYPDGYCYPTGAPSWIKVRSNEEYNLKIEHDSPTGWAATGWQLWTTEGSPVPPDHSGAYEIKDVATDLYWPVNKPATNEDNWYFYYMIDGIEYVDNWVGNHTMIVTYTLATSI